jgi:hypothetical protein
MKLMLESMFFILFGITFLFILLLIYHFKNKISVLEKNVDTMFEILNNVVGDLTKLKSYEEPSDNLQYPISGGFSQMTPSEQREIEVIETSDKEEDDEYEEDDEEEMSDDESEEEDSEDEESEEEEEEDSEEETDEEENVKTISVVLDDKIDDSHIEVEEILEEPIEEQETSVPELNEIEELNVEKLDTEETQSLEAQPKTEELMENYKKMHIQNLKKLVVSKGLATDVSKMKKVELLGLLQQETE